MNSWNSLVSSWVVSKGIALCAFLFFASTGVQIRGLLGAKGILPVTPTLEYMAMHVQGSRLGALPTLFWISSTDRALVTVCVLGAIAAAGAFAGVLAPLMFALCFLFALSIVSVGQDFFSFQWDVLLTECLFLAIFLGPWNFAPSFWASTEMNVILRWLFWLLLFKFMFLSGVVKIQSGDPTWRNLTAMQFHYETQPIPNPLAPFMHRLPGVLQRVSAGLMFVIEIGFPFLILLPFATARLIAAAGFIVLQLLILTTGNYTFFNLLTIALSISLVPGEFWKNLPAFADKIQATPMWEPWALIPMAIVAIPLVLGHAFWIFRSFGATSSLAASLIPLVRAMSPWRIDNSYGLFAVMTTSRPEIDIQGSDDGKEWKSYVFKYKPGPLDRCPPQVAPHQPRLDWQMWFAALGSFDDNPWLQNFMLRLLEGEKVVLDLLATNPFPEHPPKYVRAMVADYHFADLPLASGPCWSAGPAKAYSPVLGLGK